LASCADTDAVLSSSSLPVGDASRGGSSQLGADASPRAANGGAPGGLDASIGAGDMAVAGPTALDRAAPLPTVVTFTDAPEIVTVPGFVCEAPYGSDALDWRVLMADGAGKATLYAPVVTERKLTGSAVRSCTDQPGPVLQLPNVTVASDERGIALANNLRVGASDPDESGGYYIAGNTGQGDVALLKFDRQGKLAWAKQAGGQALESVAEVRVTKTGVYVAGTSDGVLPGQSADSRGLPFLLRYDLAGTLLWTLQPNVAYGATIDSSLNLMLEVDAQENAYLFDKSTLAKVSPSGQLAWQTRWTQRSATRQDESAEADALPARVSSIRVFPTAQSDAVWLAAAGRSEEAQPARDDAYLLKVGPGGRHEQLLVLKLGHDQLYERGADTLWHGRIDGPALRVIDQLDTLYVLVGYENDYELGASPPSGAYAEAIYKLDTRQANVAWAKQYRAPSTDAQARTALVADYVRKLDGGELLFGVRQGPVASDASREQSRASSPLRGQLRPAKTGLFRVSTSTGNLP
jgi:hypothetical protein